MKTKPCNNCGKLVTRTDCRLKEEYHVFCNKRCHIEYKKSNGWKKKIYDGQQSDGSILLICFICNKKFTEAKEKYFFSAKNLCSQECKTVYLHNRGNRIIKQCECCGQNVEKYKSKAQSPHVFCNRSCFAKYQKTIRRMDAKCINCEKIISVLKDKFARNNGKVFCNHSCASHYNNSHNKKSGTQISKVEKYIQEKLVNLYPNIEFQFNMKTTILSELDIFCPSLKLAFELNGIFHYEPIFGKEKLEYTQNNDQRKFQACLERGIELVTIDTSQLKYVKPDRIEPYLKIIINIIDQKIKAA